MSVVNINLRLNLILYIKLFVIDIQHGNGIEIRIPKILQD